MSAGLCPPAAAAHPSNDRERAEDRPQDRNNSQPQSPIILLSACPRSGSNYLENLLSLHPRCRRSTVPEDFFLANSETLLNFCRSVADSWDDWWLERLGGPSRLAMHIGTALLRFACSAPGKLGQRQHGVDWRLQGHSHVVCQARPRWPGLRLLSAVACPLCGLRGLLRWMAGSVPKFPADLGLHSRRERQRSPHRRD